MPFSIGYLQMLQFCNPENSLVYPAGSCPIRPCQRCSGRVQLQAVEMMMHVGMPAVMRSTLLRVSRGRTWLPSAAAIASAVKQSTCE
jgi:hypothetical protein